MHNKVLWLIHWFSVYLVATVGQTLARVWGHDADLQNAPFKSQVRIRIPAPQWQHLGKMTPLGGHLERGSQTRDGTRCCLRAAVKCPDAHFFAIFFL